ncbi:MAG: hypothetical protein H8E98_05935 [Bacteroidetes bacterium]|nr:hypothetical protein [Bacteroidota bacterium]
MKTRLYILVLTITLSSVLVKAQVTKDTILVNLTKEILLCFKNQEYKKITDYIHPTLGIRFTPYAYIDTIRNLRFTADNFAFTIDNDQLFDWGYYDGIGSIIRLTLHDYIKKFVYDVDFLNPEVLSINKSIGYGNMINNIKEMYKGCDFVENYFSGFDEDAAGGDWRGLRLVFKKDLGTYYLIGIIHDKWTI